jgi:hypothetical protein
MMMGKNTSATDPKSVLDSVLEKLKTVVFLGFYIFSRLVIKMNQSTDQYHQQWLEIGEAA